MRLPQELPSASSRRADYLDEFLALAPEILVADSRVKSLELPPYRRIAELTATTLPDLDEPGEFRRIGIYQAGGH